jgi:hypothetical protein
MLQATSNITGPPFTVNATVKGLAVYLDNWAVIDLAEGDASRRFRFVRSLCAGGDLLFSTANAAELIGSQGESLDAVKHFLDQLGRHWVPVEMDPNAAMEREKNGESRTESCISQKFVHAYFRDRVADCTRGPGKVIDLSEDFFRLGAVLDWVVPQRQSIIEKSRRLDEALIARIGSHRTEFERDSSWLNENIPRLPFNPSKRATFANVNLIRTLVEEAKTHPLKKGDGMDFCHAVLASAFSSVGTLDKHWKRRVMNLPWPNGLVHIYAANDLDEMVRDMELHVKPTAPTQTNAEI